MQLKLIVMNRIQDVCVVAPFLAILVQVVQAGEYCTRNGHYEYCSGYCCSSGDDGCCSEDWGWIAGVVVGCIIFVAIVGTIIFLICSKMKAKKSQTIHVQNMQRIQHDRSMELNQMRHNRRTNMFGNQFNAQPLPNQGLPPPPPYSQTGQPNPAYMPPPPYPGTPLPPPPPPQYNTLTPRNNYTSLGNTAGGAAYPPPPVS